MQEKKSKQSIEAFFALLSAGLWEKEVRLLPLGDIDYSVMQQLAEEQSVVGLIAAGMEHVSDTKIPKQDLLQFIGQTLQIEEQNKAMNYFIGVIIEKMRHAGIYTLLVKGQGIAQCYEKPLWRSNGDVDLLLSDDNYQKAKDFLTPLAAHVDNEDKRIKHLGMTIDPWIVELHGTMYTELSGRVNRGVEDAQRAIFNGGEVRSWLNENVQVFLPNAENDIILVFTHILNHFYVGGVGLRQICDWCRLLWTYRDKIDRHRLERRLKDMGVMSEWRVFGAFAVEYLGMPVETMPMFGSSVQEFKSRAGRLCHVIMKSGNMGHNIDQSYRQRYPKLIEKSITFFHRLGEFVRISSIFPINAPCFFVTYVYRRVKAFISR